jgi:hypothetical protein
MAKKKKNQYSPTTPETEPGNPAPGLPQDGLDVPPPVEAYPGSEVAEPVLAAAPEAGTGSDLPHVNHVDRAGTEIVLAEVFGEMLDATVEEPTYPAHEWQGPAEPMVVLPDDNASDEELIEGARHLVDVVRWRMRRTVQEWWLIGHHLRLLKARPSNDGRWRTEVLPTIGINHTTDHQLRTLAESITFEACLDFNSKTEALRSIGFFATPQPKQLSGPQTATSDDGEVMFQTSTEETLGSGGDPAYEFIGVDALFQAAPFEMPEVGAGAGDEPPVGALADEVAQPSDRVQPSGETKAKAPAQAGTKRTGPERGAVKIAAKAAPQPEQDDLLAEAEAIVVTLSGAEITHLGAVIAESGLTPIASTQDRIVGMLWYGDDTYKTATERVGKLFDRLRVAKRAIQVEARYLQPSDLIAV